MLNTFKKILLLINGREHFAFQLFSSHLRSLLVGEMQGDSCSLLESEALDGLFASLLIISQSFCASFVSQKERALEVLQAY